jgi:hypothetical protein
VGIEHVTGHSELDSQWANSGQAYYVSVVVTVYPQFTICLADCTTETWAKEILGLKSSSEAMVENLNVYYRS